MNDPASDQPIADIVKNLNSPSDRLLLEQTIPQLEEKSDQGRPPTIDPAIPASAVAQSRGRADQPAFVSEQLQEMTSDTKRGRTLGQILIILVVAVLLVNVPISYRGAGLIHSVPDATPVVIYNGMALKGSGPEVYILENHKLRQFSSPDTFNYFHSRYHLKVHLVDDKLLQQFGQGQPIRRLVKCRALPYIYALENGQKRRVKILPPSNQASPWDNIGVVACGYLSDMPNGPPMPENGVEVIQP